MWSYYGSKFKLVKHYPQPQHDTIVEAFAGAGWYSLTHSSHNVIINELDDRLYEIWYWLIHDATPEDILAHTEFRLGDTITNLDIPTPHKNMIGFCFNRGSTQPKLTVSKWSCQSKKTLSGQAQFHPA